MMLWTLSLGEAHTSISTPGNMRVLVLLRFVEDSPMITKAAPALSRSESPLDLQAVERFEDGVVQLRYRVQNHS